MEINDKMQIAYTQVDTVLNFYNQDLLAISIPQEVRDYIRKNKSKVTDLILMQMNSRPTCLQPKALVCYFGYLKIILQLKNKKK